MSARRWTPPPPDIHLAEQLETAARIVRGDLPWDALEEGEWRPQPKAFSVLYFLHARIDIRVRPPKIVCS